MIVCVIAWLLLGSAINYAQAFAFDSRAVRERLSLRTVFAANQDGLLIRKNEIITQASFNNPVITRLILAKSQSLPLAERPYWLWIMPWPDDSKMIIISQRALGWPVRCLTRSYEVVQRICPDPAYMANPQRWATMKKIREFPLIPLWPGFLLNALIWGSPVLLIPAAKELRRVRRRRRGLCPQCGYDLRPGMLPSCPECGFGASEPA